MLTLTFIGKSAMARFVFSGNNKKDIKCKIEVVTYETIVESEGYLFDNGMA